MPEPWEWQEGDLQNLVSQRVTEGLELDYKRCLSLDISTDKAREKSRFDLAKDVSSFANSSGGAIVYGIVEKNHVADALDSGYDPNVITREWIEQIITSNIHPKVTGVRVRTVELQQHASGKVAYVVHVPQGTTAHQHGVDRRYYRRHGSESIPMEDYEIRDVMNRTLAPRVSIEVTFNSNRAGNLQFTSKDDYYVSPLLRIFVVNEASAAVAEYLQAQIFVATAALSDKGRGWGSPSQTVFSIPGGFYLDYRYVEQQISKADLPLFPGERRPMFGDLNLWFRQSQEWPRDLKVPLILWRVRVNNSEANHGAIFFECIRPDSWDYGPGGADELPGGASVNFAP